MMGAWKQTRLLEILLEHEEALPPKELTTPYSQIEPEPIFSGHVTVQDEE
jgi:hypothetical protein